MMATMPYARGQRGLCVERMTVVPNPPHALANALCRQLSATYLQAHMPQKRHMHMSESQVCCVAAEHAMCMQVYGP